jgi:hypothetical protein
MDTADDEVLFIFIPLNRFGKIISTKAIIDQSTNKCKGMKLRYRQITRRATR